MSLKAKPMATEPIPSAPTSLAGVKPGMAITIAIIKPIKKINAPPIR